MTAKSTRRSTNRRINSTSSYFTKIRRLWNYTNNSLYPTPNHKPLLPIHYPITMRNSHNKLHLLTPNRPKISNRLLLNQPHSSSNHRYSYTITTKLHRCYSPNNRPWSNIFHTILSSQHKLRTHQQSNYNLSSRITNHSPINMHLMNLSHPS